MKKLVIVGFPRTSSKMILRNFTNYIKLFQQSDISVVYNPTLNIKAINLDEILHQEHPYWFTGRAILDPDENLMITDTPIVSILDEIQSRINIISTITRPYVLKHFPYKSYYFISDQILKSCDTVYYLSRKDTFSHAISFCLSRITNSWAPNDFQKNLIESSKNFGIEIPVDLFKKVCSAVLWYNNQYLENKNAIDFNDIVKIDNSDKFLELFNLPYINFQFENNDLEFGDNKFQMISNIDELKNIFKNMEDDVGRLLLPP